MKIRQITFTLFLFLPFRVFGVYDYYFLKELFFTRRPGARAEAMGKSYTSIDGDMGCAFFNPAGTATIKGMELNGSLSTPYYLLEKAKHYFVGGGYSFKHIFIGASAYRFSFGQPIATFDSSGNYFLTDIIPATSNFTFTISSQPVKNLLIGLNANYLLWEPGPIDPAHSFYFDFGAIKKLELLKQKKSEHMLSVAASVTNMTNSKLTWNFMGTEHNSELPVISRFGANYQYTCAGYSIKDSLKTVSFLISAEYQDVLNSKYESAIRLGGEIIIYEIIAVRIGYYNETNYDFGNPDYNKTNITDFTYGFGIQIPVYKLSKTPLTINCDLTTLPQPSFSKVNTELDNFTNLNLRLNWMFNLKK